MSNFTGSLLKGYYLPFSAIFFSLDQVEGYRRVFSVEDTSYVFLFLPSASVITHHIVLSAVYATRMCHVPSSPLAYSPRIVI